MKNSVLMLTAILCILISSSPASADKLNRLIKKSDISTCRDFLQSMNKALQKDGDTATNVANLLVAFREDTEADRQQLHTERIELFKTIYGAKDISDPDAVSSAYGDVSVLRENLFIQLEALMVNIQGVTTDEQYRKIVKTRIQGFRCLLSEKNVFNRVLNAWLSEHAES